jgi:SAM-dependent methyltransferase
LPAAERLAPPSASAIADAARRSSLRFGPGLSELADRDELRYRDELEPYPDPARDVVRWLERKQLPRLLEESLRLAGVRPAGTVVELGAGTCWLGATLARRPEVERVVSVEFSRRRIEELAPIAIAHLGAPAEKIERLVADFYAHGLGREVADFVFTDAAFHHAADPVQLARVAYELLRPGGTFVLHREPTLALLRRRRPHGLEGEHGDFEHEYDWWKYVGFLREAGFEASKARAPVGFSTLRERLHVRRPLSWVNGLWFSMWTYVGDKPLASP